MTNDLEGFKAKDENRAEGLSDTKGKLDDLREAAQKEYMRTLQSWLDEAGVKVKLILPVVRKDWGGSTLELQFDGHPNWTSLYMNKGNLRLENPTANKAAFLRRFAELYSGEPLDAKEVQRIKEYADVVERKK